MGSLFTYMKAVQRFTRDSGQQLLNPEDLRDHINAARREVAMRAQAVRILTPISGAIAGATIVFGGENYSNPTIVISPPDSPSGFLPFPNGNQATALVTQSGGSINAVNIANGGAGYFLPTCTITDPTGSGAIVKLTTTINSTLNQGQEKYDFENIDVSQFPGVKSVYSVKSISIIYSSYRFSLPVYSFSTYQAMIRQYTASQFLYVPAFASQLGRGAKGSLFLYPPPSQEYQLELDCWCLPSDLMDDADYEAIPEPWDDLVPFYGTFLAMLELQNGNSARMYLELFDDRMKRFGGYVQPGRAVNPYSGRW